MVAFERTQRKAGTHLGDSPRIRLRMHREMSLHQSFHRALTQLDVILQSIISGVRLVTSRTDLLLA